MDVMVDDDTAVWLGMLQDMEAQNQHLSQLLQQKDQELYELMQKLQMAEERLQKRETSYTQPAVNTVCLKLNQVQNLYAGEVAYFVIDALKSHRLYGHHKRLTQVVDDLTQSNAAVLNQVEQDLAALKAALVGYKGPTPKIEEILGRFGIELVENNKHIKAKFIQDTSLGMVTLGKSASDQKAGMNNFKYFTDNMLPHMA